MILWLTVLWAGSLESHHDSSVHHCSGLRCQTAGRCLPRWIGWRGSVQWGVVQVVRGSHGYVQWAAPPAASDTPWCPTETRSPGANVTRSFSQQQRGTKLRKKENLSASWQFPKVIYILNTIQAFARYIKLKWLVQTNYDTMLWIISFQYSMYCNNILLSSALELASFILLRLVCLSRVLINEVSFKVWILSLEMRVKHFK